MTSRSKALGFTFAALALNCMFAFAQAAGPASSKIGSVKSINGNNIVLRTDAGQEVTVTVQQGTRLLQLAPGQTDLKSAAPIQLQDIQTGDRMLARGHATPDGQGLEALALIVMKQSAVAQKQQQDLQDWQRHGAGGIVKSIDPSGVITVSVTPTSEVTVRTSPSTSFLRYASNSIKFSDAVHSSFDQIKIGDQLRARGQKSADGKEITAAEVISGSFRNIAGTVAAIDPAQNTVTVKDLLSKKTVTVKLNQETEFRKIPPQIAQRLAFFLRAQAGEGAAPAGGARPASAQGMRPGGFQRPSGPPDFQQMMQRLPSATLADLQKDDAVMIVSTPGTDSGQVTAITMLSGVEPILTAAPNGSGAATLLSGWNMSSGSDAAAAAGGGPPQ